jgi:enoyl-CoA hydratase/carnithine racemase
VDIATATEQLDLLRQDKDGVAWLTLNRPAARNALSLALMEALDAALVAAASDPAIRVVVIAGAGPAFCSGHDLRELRAQPTEAHYDATFATCSRLMTRVTRLPKPVIAHVHGVATAAGCQLVAACDLAIAGEAARFATSGINNGLFCSTPAVALGRAVGRKAAMEMLLTGEMIDAARAREIGLVNRVVPTSELDGAVTALAAQIASKSARAIAIGKEAFYRQIVLVRDAAYRCASAAMTENMLEPDAEEGVDAFLAKRAPVWKS